MAALWIFNCNTVFSSSSTDCTALAVCCIQLFSVVLYMDCKLHRAGTVSVICLYSDSPNRTGVSRHYCGADNFCVRLKYSRLHVYLKVLFLESLNKTCSLCTVFENTGKAKNVVHPFKNKTNPPFFFSLVIYSVLNTTLGYSAFMVNSSLWILSLL